MGIARGKGHGPQSWIEWIFYGIYWLCWDVEPSFFSKVTLFSLPEVFCGFLRAQVLTAMTKKRLSTVLRKKCTLAASVPPPNVKSWLCAALNPCPCPRVPLYKL